MRYTHPARRAAVAALLTLAGCGVSGDPAAGESSLPLIEDARSIVANGTGGFTVVCNDGSIEQNVTASKIAAQEICKPAPPSQPQSQPAPPPTSWSTAEHVYKGELFTVSPDDRFALVDFENVGFGSFDLRSYTLRSFGQLNWISSFNQVLAAGTRVLILKREVPFPGTSARGLQIELRDLADPSFSHTINRPPQPGAGNLDGYARVICDDWATWKEGGSHVTARFAGGQLTLVENSELEVCAAVKWVDPTKAIDRSRQDRRVVEVRTQAGDRTYKLESCSAGSCTNVRTLAPGTSWVAFSRSGSFIAYQANGFTYRDSLSGGALKQLPNGAPFYAPNSRDGTLASSSGIYDIDSDTVVPLPAPFARVFGADLLPNRVSAYRTEWGQQASILLINESRSTVVVPTGTSYSTGRVGLYSSATGPTDFANVPPRHWIL